MTAQLSGGTVWLPQETIRIKRDGGRLGRDDLTALAMHDSGEVFDWRSESLPGPVLDKHSTGGVGDLVSLTLGPMLAAEATTERMGTDSECGE